MARKDATPAEPVELPEPTNGEIRAVYEEEAAAQRQVDEAASYLELAKNRLQTAQGARIALLRRGKGKP